MRFGFQFNSSDSSDDDLYRLEVKVTSEKLSLYSWNHILVHQKKIEQGVP